MNKRKYTVLLFIALVLISIIVGCVPHRTGVSWADAVVVGDGNQILVSYNDFMVLVDPANGTPARLLDNEGNARPEAIWEVKSEGSQFFTSPTWLDDETLLVADYNNKLAFVNYKNACMSNRTGSCVDNPIGIELPGHVMADGVISEGIAYLPLMEQGVVAIDINEGTIVWQFETKRGVWTSPLLIDDTLYVSSMDHSLYAIATETGRIRWELDLDGAIASTPVLYNDRLYVGTFGRELLEISKEGEILSEVGVENWIWSSPVIFDDTLYVTDLSGYVYAFEPQGLIELWKKDTKSDGIRPSPIVTDDYVIAASRDGKIFWMLRDTGELLDRTQDVEAEILSELILLERSEETLIIVSTTKGGKTLVAFTINGDHRWTYER